MIGIGISPMFKRGGSSIGAYTAAFKTVVESRGGSLTADELIYLTTFENTMGSELTKCDRLGIIGLSNQIAANTSFINPSSSAITPVNSPTWSSYYQSNGTTSYVNLNYNPSTQGVNYTRNSACAFLYQTNNVTEIALAIGSLDASNLSGSIYTKIGANATYYINNAATDTNIAVADSLGFYSIVRDGASSTKLYKNGTLIKSGSLASTPIPNLNCYLCGVNSLGSLLLPSTGKFTVYGYASSLIDQTVLRNAIQALGTSLGWAV